MARPILWALDCPFAIREEICGLGYDLPLFQVERTILFKFGESPTDKRNVGVDVSLGVVDRVLRAAPHGIDPRLLRQMFKERPVVDTV